MATGSKIEWTDHTFNPWWGCTKVHDGCKHCYAESWDARWGGDHWGPRASRRMILGEWSKPAKWNADAEQAGRMARVFCASMCDLFEDFDGPVVDQQGSPLEWTVPALRERSLAMVRETPWLDWLLLTKRPENVVGMVPADWRDDWPTNVMVGTSPCNQATADGCVPALLRVPGRRFLSCEPLLGPVSLADRGWLYDNIGGTGGEQTIHWVIVGGESGPGARPMDPDWARDIRDQCVNAGVPFLFKQWGGVNKKATGRTLDGRTWDEFPSDRLLAEVQG